jgi:hypothetical protein
MKNHNSGRSLWTAKWLGWAVVCSALVATVAGPVLATAQELGDRSEVERKKREREEAERAKAALVVQETDEQREERERIERRETNVKLAKQKFAQAAQAAAKRQNDRGLELMHAAWMLDPTTLDYPVNTAEFAKALQNTETEFRALAAIRILAKRILSNASADLPNRPFVEESLTNATNRIDVVKSKVSSGLLQLTVEPANCELFVEGAYVGVGSGEIEAMTGQRKVETRCPGYFDHEMFVNVRSGDPTVAKVKPNPVPYFGNLVLQVSPADGVQVFLDDMLTELRKAEKPTRDGLITGKGTKEEPYRLAARKWVIRFNKEGYDRWHRRIEIRRDQTTVVEARLESLAELDAAAAEKDKAAADKDKAAPPAAAAPPKGKK